LRPRLRRRRKIKIFQIPLWSFILTLFLLPPTSCLKLLQLYLRLSSPTNIFSATQFFPTVDLSNQSHHFTEPPVSSSHILPPDETPSSQGAIHYHLVITTPSCSSQTVPTSDIFTHFPASDTVCAIGFIDQLQFFGTMACASSVKRLKIPCVVDTGAGEGYLLLPHGDAVPFPTRPAASWVRLADGRHGNIRAEISVRLQINHSHVVTIYILHSDCESPLLFFRRRLIELFQLTIEGSSRLRMGKATLYDSRTDRVHLVEDLRQPEGLVDVLPPATVSQIVDLPVPEETKSRNLQIIAKLVGSDRPMQFCRSTQDRPRGA